MPRHRPRVTIRALMVASALVAVVLTLVLRAPRGAFVAGNRWLVFGPPLVFLMPRLLVRAWLRRARESADAPSRPCS